MERRDPFNVNNSVSKKLRITKRVFFSAKVQCSNYNINILLKFIVFNTISVTTTVQFIVLFPTFSNANRLGKALNFDNRAAKYMAATFDFKERYCAIPMTSKLRATLIRLTERSVN